MMKSSRDSRRRLPMNRSHSACGQLAQASPKPRSPSRLGTASSAPPSLRRRVWITRHTCCLCADAESWLFAKAGRLAQLLRRPLVGWIRLTPKCTIRREPSSMMAYLRRAQTRCGRGDRRSGGSHSPKSHRHGCAGSGPGLVRGLGFAYLVDVLLDCALADVNPQLA